MALRIAAGYLSSSDSHCRFGLGLSETTVGGRKVVQLPFAEFTRPAQAQGVFASRAIDRDCHTCDHCNGNLWPIQRLARSATCLAVPVPGC